MALSRLVKGKTVFLDTAPFIYFIEKNSRYHDLIKPVISLIDAQEAQGITSTMTLLEVLVRTLRDGNKKLIKYDLRMPSGRPVVWNVEGPKTPAARAATYALSGSCSCGSSPCILCRRERGPSPPSATS